MAYYKNRINNKSVKVDIDNIKDEEVKNKIFDMMKGVYVSIDISTIDKDIRSKLLKTHKLSEVPIPLDKIKNDRDLYNRFVADSIDSFENTHLLNDYIDFVKQNSYNSTKQINELLFRCLNNIDKKLVSPYHTIWYGGQIVRLVNVVSPYMNSETKKKFISSFGSNVKRFYSGSREGIVKTLLSLVEDENDLLNIVADNYRYMNGDTFDKVLDKVSNGADNPVIKNVLSKTKKFNATLYDEKKVKSDPKEKIKLLKDIARTPTSCKNVTFDIDFSFEELKKVAPVMRMNFLEWYHKEIFWTATRWCNNPKMFIQKLPSSYQPGAKRVKLPVLNDEQLNNLLFTLTFNKTQRAIDFKNKYKGFIRLKNGDHFTKEEAMEYFGNVAKWYYGR